MTEELHKHLHDIPQRLKEIPSHIEQQPPNKPSFLTVVILSSVVIIIAFIIALIVLHVAHGRIDNPFRAHPASQLVLPAASPASLA
ncbi:MAG TPA: hypothetical protein VFW30_10435 [Bryocella sp.]|nr:hypothetical protein [Bryocella sp.]